MDLHFLNDLKKEDKGKRREQNKRYRQKYKELLNLKKQRSYHQENLEKKIVIIYILVSKQSLDQVQMVLLFIIEQKKKAAELLRKMIFFYATQVASINMVLQMLLELSVLQNQNQVSKIFTLKY